MKDFLFKGEYLLKLDTVKEAFWAVNKKIIATQIVFIVLELLVWTRAFFDNELILGTAWIMLWLFILILLYNTLRAPKNQIKAIELKYHKDSLLSGITFTNNAIIVYDTESGWTFQFYYNQLMKYFETKNLCVLVLWLPKTVLYVNKDSIEGWNKDELLKFIEWKIKENLETKKGK
jgi:hypothetical protein